MYRRSNRGGSGYGNQCDSKGNCGGAPIIKNIYNEHPSISSRSNDEVAYYRKAIELTIIGENVPRPITHFSECSFPDYIQRDIEVQKFEKPTAIQSQAWPIALSGHDMVGIAQTGSGKTLAYIIPGIIHINHQSASKNKDGPVVLVLSPTRELAQQIQTVCTDFGRSSNIRNACIFGGAPKWQQLKELQNGALICIATPGRLLDLLESKKMSLHNISFLVLDEADRMLDMGFEPQIRQIIEQIRPDRQTLMFSATWPKEVQKLAEDFLVDYIQINVGSLQLCANHNITQIVDVVDESDKDGKLDILIQEIMSEKENKTIIFAETKRRVDELTRFLKHKGFYAKCIHGNKSQEERDWVLKEFRSGKSPILIATDVAARGLDVNDIKYVINVDYPNNSEDYIHRIGRTGRSNNVGTAFTFFTFNNIKQAKELVDIMQEANQVVKQDLLDLMEMSKSFGSSGRGRYGNKSRGGGRGSFGKGYGGQRGNHSYGNNNKYNNDYKNYNNKNSGGYQNYKQAGDYDYKGGNSYGNYGGSTQFNSDTSYSNTSSYDNSQSSDGSYNDKNFASNQPTYGNKFDNKRGGHSSKYVSTVSCTSLNGVTRFR